MAAASWQGKVISRRRRVNSHRNDDAYSSHESAQQRTAQDNIDESQSEKPKQEREQSRLQGDRGGDLVSNGDKIFRIFMVVVHHIRDGLSNEER